MEKLKEIEVQANPPAGNNEDCCSYFKAKTDDKQSHRPGLCVINIGAAYEHCPRLERFMGHNLAELPLRAKDKGQSQLTFKIWNTRLKKYFHEDYAKSGGTLDLKAWRKMRWKGQTFLIALAGEEFPKPFTIACSKPISPKHTTISSRQSKPKPHDIREKFIEFHLFQ